MPSRQYDLEERLLEYSINIIRVVELMNGSRAAIHVADQLLRSGTSPYGNHGEAEGAESRADFLHKLKVCYKELRESRRWLLLAARVPLVPDPAALDPTIAESHELILIFAASIRTAKRNEEAENA